MPIRTIAVDDLDEKTELAGDPNDYKVSFAWEGRAYTVYLSDASKKKVADFLAPLVKNAVDNTPDTPPTGNGADSAPKVITLYSKLDGTEKTDFRAWLKKTYDATGNRSLTDERVKEWKDAGKPAA